MYIKQVKFLGIFAEGDKMVELSVASGSGDQYHLVVRNSHWGAIEVQLWMAGDFAGNKR